MNTDYVLDLNDINSSIKTIVGVDPNKLELSNYFGSCQYYSSELYHKLLDKVGHEVMGISFSGFHKEPTINLLSEVWKEVLKDYEYHAKNYRDWVDILQKDEKYWVEKTWLHTRKPEDRAIECAKAGARYEKRFLEFQEIVEKGIAHWTLEDVMDFLRGSSWDLWSAAPFVLDYQFDDLEFIDVKNPAAGKGMPLINMMIQQNEAYDTGMATYLLHKFCGVSISSMDGFDT